MTKTNYIQVVNIQVYPYEYSTYFHQDFPTLDKFTNCKHFLLDPDQNRIAVAVDLLNVEWMNPDFVPNSVNMAVELRLDDEVVASKDFAVCFSPGVEEMHPRVYLDLTDYELSTECEYEIWVRALRNRNPICTKTIRFFKSGPIKDFMSIRSGYFYTSGQKLRCLERAETDYGDCFALDLANDQRCWNEIPELEGWLYDNKGNRQRLEAFYDDYDVKAKTFRAIFPVKLNPDLHSGHVYIEFSILGHVFGGLVLQTSMANEEGVFAPDEFVTIPGYTFEKGLTVLDKRGERTSKGSIARKELENMVGLGNVKRKLSDCDHLMRFFQMRKRQGLPVQTFPLHALFLGSPGTGKTTVAKLMGALLKDAGVLSKGHVVVKERASLINHYYGSGEQRTHDAIEEAQGGILFIDEAYQLYAPNEPKDPGKDVIRSLLTVLADEQNRDIMVILAGYTEPVLKMLEMNPGLSSRFPRSNHYVFDDYTPDELIEIARRYFMSNSYLLTPDAEKALCSLLRSDYEHRQQDFGNARHVMNIIQTGILPSMARRISQATAPDRDALSLIQASDIPAPRFLELPAPSHRPLGFAA